MTCLRARARRACHISLSLVVVALVLKPSVSSVAVAQELVPDGFDANGYSVALQGAARGGIFVAASANGLTARQSAMVLGGYVDDAELAAARSAIAGASNALVDGTAMSVASGGMFQIAERTPQGWAVIAVAAGAMGATALAQRYLGHSVGQTDVVATDPSPWSYVPDPGLGNAGGVVVHGLGLSNIDQWINDLGADDTGVWNNAINWGCGTGTAGFKAAHQGVCGGAGASYAKVEYLVPKALGAITWHPRIDGLTASYLNGPNDAGHGPLNHSGSSVTDESVGLDPSLSYTLYVGTGESSNSSNNTGWDVRHGTAFPVTPHHLKEWWDEAQNDLSGLHAPVDYQHQATPLVRGVVAPQAGAVKLPDGSAYTGPTLVTGTPSSSLPTVYRNPDHTQSVSAAGLPANDAGVMPKDPTWDPRPVKINGFYLVAPGQPQPTSLAPAQGTAELNPNGVVNITPAGVPTTYATTIPYAYPTTYATTGTIIGPSNQPTIGPTTVPTTAVTTIPTTLPTTIPSSAPSAEPTPPPTGSSNFLTHAVDIVTTHFPGDAVADLASSLPAIDSHMHWTSFEGQTSNGTDVSHDWDLDWVKVPVRALELALLAGLMVAAIIAI